MNIKDINEFKHQAKWKWYAILKKEIDIPKFEGKKFLIIEVMLEL